MPQNGHDVRVLSKLDLKMIFSPFLKMRERDFFTNNYFHDLLLNPGEQSSEKKKVFIVGSDFKLKKEKLEEDRNRTKKRMFLLQI